MDKPKNKSALFPKIRVFGGLENKALKTRNNVLEIYKHVKIKRNKKIVSKLNI